jgi:hypothetical protein
VTNALEINVTADSEKALSEALHEVVLRYIADSRVYSLTEIKGSRLSLSIVFNDLDNAAFVDDPVSEICRILAELASKLTIETNCKLMDFNGNSVGRAIVELRITPIPSF